MTDKDTRNEPLASKPSPKEEARQVVQEYIANQREILRKLYRFLS